MMRPSIVLALALVASPGVARAQGPAAAPAADSVRATPALGEVRGAFLALSVADLEASTRWYRDVLGLRVTMSVPRNQGAAVTVLEGGGLTVELLQLDAAAPRAAGGAEQLHGIFKVGVVVDDLARALATLQARGVQVVAGPFPARGGQRANAIIRDNAGNMIQLFGR